MYPRPRKISSFVWRHTEVDVTAPTQEKELNVSLEQLGTIMTGKIKLDLDFRKVKKTPHDFMVSKGK